MRHLTREVFARGRRGRALGGLATPIFGQTSASGQMSHFGLRQADLPAVGNHAVRKVDPLAPRQLGDQVALDLHRVGVPGHAQPLAQPTDVRVDHDARREAEGRAQHDVGRLAADAGQLDERVQVARHLAVMLFDQLLAAAGNALGLVAKEAGALDGPLELGPLRPGEGGGIWDTCGTARA